MILSLVFALVVFIPAIMLIGISEMGSQMIGLSGTASAMNVTAWNAYSSTYSSLGIIPLLMVTGIGVVILVVAITYAIKKE